MTSRWTVCVVATWLVPAAAAAQPTSPPRESLSLAAAIRLAVENNRSLAAARLQVERADEDLAVARTRRLPSFETSVMASQLVTPVSFSFPRGAFGDFTGLGPVPAVDTDISSPRRVNVYASSQVTQPISQLVRINLGIQTAAATRELERERLRDQQLALVNSVKRLYFAILQSESAIVASDEAVTLYRELDRTLDVRVAQKVALRSDALEVKAKLSQEELTRLTHANTLDSQKEQLNQLLGRDVRTRFDTEGVPDISELDVDLQAAQGRALDERSDVRQARLTLKQAELDRQLKKAERIPDFSFVGSYMSNFNIDVLPRNLAAVGMQLKWEPFDWGRKGRQLAAKSHAVEQARLSVRDAEDRAVLEVNSRFRKLGEMRALLKAAAAAQSAAREKLRVTTNRYQIQTALLTDVLHLRAELADSDDQYQQALLAFWTAKADFERAVGEEVSR